MALLFPGTDVGLLAWSAHFSQLISVAPISYGLVAAQATTYAAVHAAFAVAMGECDPPVRSKGSTAAKNTAKANLKLAANQTASIINGTPFVTVAQKVTLGIPPRAAPTTIPAPSSAPGVTVRSVVGWTVSLRLYDTVSSAKRGKPPGVSGASVFSFVGATPPADISAWKFNGNTGRTKFDVEFDSTLVPGTKVFVTAFWFNGRKQPGPACSPVTTFLQGGSVSMAA